MIWSGRIQVKSGWLAFFVQLFGCFKKKLVSDQIFRPVSDPSLVRVGSVWVFLNGLGGFIVSGAPRSDLAFFGPCKLYKLIVVVIIFKYEIYSKNNIHRKTKTILG